MLSTIELEAWVMPQKLYPAHSRRYLMSTDGRMLRYTLGANTALLISAIATAKEPK